MGSVPRRAVLIAKILAESAEGEILPRRPTAVSPLNVSGPRAIRRPDDICLRKSVRRLLRHLLPPFSFDAPSIPAPECQCQHPAVSPEEEAAASTLDPRRQQRRRQPPRSTGRGEAGQTRVTRTPAGRRQDAGPLAKLRDPTDRVSVSTLRSRAGPHAGPHAGPLAKRPPPRPAPAPARERQHGRE